MPRKYWYISLSKLIHNISYNTSWPCGKDIGKFLTETEGNQETLNNIQLIINVKILNRLGANFGSFRISNFPYYLSMCIIIFNITHNASGSPKPKEIERLLTILS